MCPNATSNFPSGAAGSFGVITAGGLPPGNGNGFGAGAAPGAIGVVGTGTWKPGITPMPGGFKRAGGPRAMLLIHRRGELAGKV